ncbi:FAD-binding domain-containing protein [Terfezia boudieri ATCC MYA-4762]|uniref:D-lactate dehydrogenase (cytochrome) n=1 Tax=Terfezia boudieri ATCC MYA-4762 TaxID=1051890 RepID=A0A3N4LLP5_9PEZI|nr:FAD-binding domain-containing protein [Terfezia boudieri ATCC MYA-4762]
MPLPRIPSASVLRRTCTAATTCRTGYGSISRRTFQSTARTQDTGKDKDPKNSFQGQLYSHTAERVKQQRAEEARAIRSQQAQAAGSSRIWAGLLASLFIAGAFYYLGANSVAPAPQYLSTTPIHLSPAPKHNLSKGNLEASWTDFVSLLGEDHVSTAPSELARHSSSDWSSHPRQPGEPLPFLILFPSTTKEVSEIMKICHKRRLPATAFSGGTSLEGHFAPTRGGVVIDFQRMDKILKVHDKDLDAIVQPAVGWEYLNEELMKDNLFFPPDPGPGAMIGGMVGTGCSGTNAARYGTMKEWVLSLTVVLADGTVIKTRQRPRKSSAGYDLTRMFIGSEGTLGLVTEITLKLAVKPPNESVAVANFSTIREATDVVEKIVAQGIQVAAVELLDDVQMKCINDAGMTEKKWKEAPTLFFKFSGTKNAVKEQVGLVREIIKKSSQKAGFEFAKNAEEATELWEARKEALWSVIALKQTQHDHPPKSHDEKLKADVGGSAGHNEGADTQKVWTTDVAVPVSRLSDIVEETKRDIKEWSDRSPGGGVGAIVGHVGDGNFHCILLFEERERPIVEEIVHRMVKRAIEMEGTVTGEHGVGLVKRDYLREELGEETVDAMRKLKLAFDPLCLLNCDKVIRMEKKTSQH